MWRIASKFTYILIVTIFVVYIFLDKSQRITYADEITTTIVDTPTTTETQVATTNNQNTVINTVSSTQNDPTVIQNTPSTNIPNTNIAIVNDSWNSTTATNPQNTQITTSANVISTNITWADIYTNSWSISDSWTIINNTGFSDNITNTWTQNSWFQNSWSQVIWNQNSGSDATWLQNTYIIDVPLNIIRSKKSITYTNNLINLDSIDSYDVSGGVSTYCSMITKLNLISMINKWYSLVNNGIWSWLQISEWDATTLIDQWISQNKLVSISWFDDASGKIQNMYYNNWSNIFDFYIYTDKYQNEYKWHRFVAFIASDKNIYVLDPIRWNANTSPILMSDYLNSINQNESNIYMYYYGFGGDREINSLTSYTWEKILLNVWNLIKLFASGYITAVYNTVGWVQSATFTKDIILLDSWENEIFVSSGTTIKEKNDQQLNIYSLWFVTEESGINFSGNYWEYIDFGIKWQYLIFDKTIRFLLKSDIVDWENIQIKVKHAWDEDFWTLWITTNQDATCFSWISSNESHDTIVKNWYAEFWSCWASTFFVSSGSGSPTIAPWCNTFKDPWWVNNGTWWLFGEYFAGYHSDNLGFFNTTAVWLTRIDSRVQFTSDGSSTWWNLIPPANWSTNNYDNYSARWRWSLYIATAWMYTFWVSNADDGAYMWIDNPATSPTFWNVFINWGWLHGATTYTNTKYLNTGYINLLMYYGELWWGNTIWLERQWPWITRQYIPTSNLCSAVINSKPWWSNSCSLWLKANKWFTTSNSSPFANWRDDSWFGNDAQNTISTATSPTYISNELNFNPAIRFQWTSSIPKYLVWSKTSTTTNNISSFIVQKTRTTAWQFGKLLYLYDNTSPAVNSNNWANRMEAFMTYAWWWTDRIATIRANALQWYTDNVLWYTSILSTHFTNSNQDKFYKNWLNTINSTYNTQNFTYNAYNIWYGIWAFPAGDYTDSDIAEVITCDFDTSSSGNLRNKIESYLAIKYWITLDQTTPQSYVLTTITWWNASIASVYNKNIAWIAMDSDTDLYQPKSQSLDDTGDIIVESVNPISNKRTLIRWNDSWNRTIWSFVDSPAWFQRITRERQFQELNWDLWVTNISIPNSSLTTFSWNLFMFINNSSSFAGWSTAITWSLVNGNRVFTTNLSNLQYITFWYRANIAPVANNDTWTVTEDWSWIINVLSNDTDVNVDVLSITWLTLPANWIAVIVWTWVRYTPNANFCGIDMFTYRAFDWFLASTWVAIVTINVTCVNDAPVALDDIFYLNYTGNYNNTLVVAWSWVQINDTDIDNSWFNSTIVSGTQFGTISLNTWWWFTYTPNASLCFIWNDYFSYRDTDASGWISNIANVTISISWDYTVCKWLNRNPIARNDIYTGTKNQTLTITAIGILWNDYLVPSTWTSITQAPAIPSFNYPWKPISNVILTWPWWYSITWVLLWWSPSHVWYDANYWWASHNANFQSWWTYSRSFWARTTTWTRTISPFFTDDTNTNFQWTQTFTIDNTWRLITVTNTYTSTIWTNPRVFVTNDWWWADFYIYDPLITKLEFNTWLLTSSLVSNTTNWNISLNPNWWFVYTPNTNFCGIDTFTYRDKDYIWWALSNIATGTISIICVNYAPVSVPDIYTWFANTPLVIVDSWVLANDFDIDNSGNQLQSILISWTNNWTISLNISWWFTYTPNPYFIWTDSFSYFTKDPSGSWSTGAIVTIKVIWSSKLCIYAPDIYNSWVLNASSSGQNLTYQFDYFRIEDSKNNSSWYYTTLSVSNLTWPSGNIISNTNISIKADPLQTIAWYANPNILLNPILSTYRTANIPYNFIYRNQGNNNNLAGIYGSKLWISINVPAYTSVGTYNWTITYTLYENP